MEDAVRMVRRLAAVAFADVAGWTSLVEANELEALRAWNALRTGFVEPKIAEFSGRLVDLAGDAVFVEFNSAVDAVSWALDLQRLPQRGTGGAISNPLKLRIGINVCDVLVDEGRLVGDGVNIAARIHQLCAPGEVVVTESVKEHVHHRIAVEFRDLGERHLKNISRPIRVFRVEAEGLPKTAWVDTRGTDRARRALLAIEMPAGSCIGAPAVAEAETICRNLLDHLSHKVLPRSGGRLVAQYDGGLLIGFPKARLAVKAAFAIQKDCRNAGLPMGPAQWPRMGMQMGESVADETEMLGSGANLATRLSGIARPGEMVASSTVCDELVAELDADIEDLGECYLREMNQPVRAYRLDPPRSGLMLKVGDAADSELLPTFAVIPFSERGVGHESLGEILAEMLIAALSRSSDVNVVSRLSTTAFRGRGATPGEVGGHLHAQYVLSGTYRVSRSVLVLSTELAEARSGRVVWAQELKGSVAALIEGKDELIDRLVSEASRTVMAREFERTQHQSLQSLETCTLLIGAITLMHRLSANDFHRARDMLLAVAQRVPRHPVPQALLAKWHVLRVWQSWSPDPVADTRLAVDFGKHALDNDSQCSLALSIDGFVQTNLLKALDVAQQRYALALQVNPNDALAWLLSGMLHAFKGEGDKAVRNVRRALRLSPLDQHRFFYDSLAASAELAAGNYSRAIELARRSLRANRMHASTFRALAIGQWASGLHDDARATVAELMLIEPQLTVSNWLERSPSSAFAVGQMCADALRAAGVPA
ncbi:MAG: adenylate/guanylate cyclase domain-containing protein [Rubrivivax sp.]